ncbi:hypothetical protein BDV06DRAFT_219186 [Aspergillus oleicola]
MPKGMHNPLPAFLGSECKKATQILDSFINGSWRGSPGRELPERVLRDAKGLAILTVTKAGILGSLRFGSGILIARLHDEPSDPNSPNANSSSSQSWRWSPPSAISTMGLGFGGQAGFELTDFVFIFNDYTSLQAFSRLGSLTLSGNFSIAFGPLGRNAEYAGGISAQGAGSMKSFAKTKGLFGGVSLESGVLVERRWANRRFFGRRVTAGDILSGSVDVPEEGNGREVVEGLMRVLGEVFERGNGDGGEGAPAADTVVESSMEPTTETVTTTAPTDATGVVPDTTAETRTTTAPGTVTTIGDAVVSDGEGHAADTERDAAPVPTPVPAPEPPVQESGTDTIQKAETETGPQPAPKQVEEHDQTKAANANAHARQEAPAQG